MLALVLVLAATAAVAMGLTALAPKNLLGFALLACLASSLTAQRSLHDHVAAVAQALSTEGLEAGRGKVALIVGRDVAALDVAGVSRAAVESPAENFSDGVVAPAFWLAVFGLPGGALYKAANTADSMIGHKNERYLSFGWAAARFDDLINLPASRLAALWLIFAASFSPGADPREAWRAVRRIAKTSFAQCRMAEAAMAGALGFKLAGPRVYGGENVDDVFMGDGRADLDAADFFALWRSIDAPAPCRSARWRLCFSLPLNSSLRAKRSNPFVSVDCFASLAMTLFISPERAARPDRHAARGDRPRRRACARPPPHRRGPGLRADPAQHGMREPSWANRPWT